MSDHVDGSGTGVKLRYRLSPASLRLNVPPNVLFEKPEVTTSKSLAMNPVIADEDVANIHE